MPTDPLSTTAEMMAPSAPTSNFFDTRDSTDIIARYARSNRELEGASNRFRDQAAAEEIERKRELWDRDSVDYQERETYKSNRGELLESLASLDPNDGEYETKLGGFLSNMPEIAAQDDAVQALIRVKQNRFEEKQREFREKEREDRIIRDADRRYNERIQFTLAEEGIDTNRFLNPETGDFDALTALRSVASVRRGKEQEKVLRDQIEAAEKEETAAFEKDPTVLDAVRSGDLGKANQVFEARFADLPADIDREELLGKLGTDTVDTFVARVQAPIRAKADVTMDENVLKKQLDAAEANAKAIYSAARGLGKLSRATSSAPAQAAPKPRNPWLEGALKTIKQD